MASIGFGAARPQLHGHVGWPPGQEEGDADSKCQGILRPVSAPPKGERDHELQTRALKDISVEEQVVRSSASSDRLCHLLIGRVHDVQTSYWRVPNPDRFRMEIDRPDLIHWDEGYQGPGSRGKPQHQWL